MKSLSKVQKISAVLDEIVHPVRLAILLSIGNSEACVCHLEAALKKRQAYISQHLMALRQAGIITARKEGRFVYYSLANPALLNLIRDAGTIAGVKVEEIALPNNCECPKCEPSKYTSIIRPSLIIEEA